MQNLFNIEKGVQGKAVITLKEITDLIKVEHNKAMKQVEKLSKEPSFGQVAKIASSYTKGGGAIGTIQTYNLTKKQAIAVGAKLNNTLLMKVIDRLEELTEKPKSLSLIELLEENTKVIKQLDKKVINLEDKIKKDKPKIVFANSVSQSYSSILIGQFAKAISKDGFSIGQNRLFTWLRENGYLCQNGANYNQPKQKYIDNDYFEIIERTVNSPDGNTRLTMTTKVTGKGQVALAGKILVSGIGARLRE